MDKGPSHLRLRPHQQIERDDVRDHQNRNIEYWDHVGDAQLPRYSRKSDPDGVVIVKNEVDCPNEIECDDEQPEERTNPYGKKRQDGLSQSPSRRTSTPRYRPSKVKTPRI
jgi:hypothetical protein